MPQQYQTSPSSELCTRGYALYQAGDFQQALRVFYSAWLALPKPKDRHEEAALVLCAIGDTYFKMHKYKLAIEALRSALACPLFAELPADDQGLVFLRLGQSLMMKGEEDKAMAYLNRAHSVGGDRRFDGENPKYLYAIKNHGKGKPIPDNIYTFQLVPS